MTRHVYQYHITASSGTPWSVEDEADKTGAGTSHLEEMMKLLIKDHHQRE